MSNVAYLIPKRNQKLQLAEADPVELVDIDFVQVPLLGWTSAGEPIQMEMDYDTVAVPQSMVRKETFALRVKGSSMIEENIEDGDIVIIERRSTAENGESVVVRINNEEVTMKKFYIEKTAFACNRPTRKWNRFTSPMKTSKFWALSPVFYGSPDNADNGKRNAP